MYLLVCLMRHVFGCFLLEIHKWAPGRPRGGQEAPLPPQGENPNHVPRGGGSPGLSPPWFYGAKASGGEAS